ncbi:DMT family transporter [Futiania mangrovi]|uniref:DMT family transporter n=1 Tax=Futiania mangrovi TaxID=2959716 RepID=A0A9J6PMQ2_9PROT|nr:DMT family transporter [Futiania mangrovii]MCP1337338.1 DMT family transporter [Futiania mangrovii]
MTAPAMHDDDRPLLGVGLMFLAVAVVPAMDVLAKYLSETMPSGQVAWGRYGVQVLLTLPMVLAAAGWRGFWPPQIGLQLLRGLCFAASTTLFFTAIAYMPVADALALLFVEPMILTALSALLLGERVGPRRWTAVVVGFAGVLIILRPGMGVASEGAPLALASGVLFAFYFLTTRKLKGAAPPIVTLAFGALVGSVVLSAVLGAGTMLGDTGNFHFIAPEPWQWGALLAIGSIATGCHFLMVLAFERAPASVLAPVSYFEIVSSAALGYLVFGDFPDVWTWVGIAVIVGSGIYIAWRERQVHGTAAPKTVPEASAGV